MTLKGLSVTILLLVLARSSPDCPPNYEIVGTRCLMTCDHPIFVGCPEIFVHHIVPEVCAFLSDGSKQTYPLDCTLCQNETVIGLELGPCPIDYPLCAYGFELINGVCVDKCENLVCEAGEHCISGECQPLQCE